MRNCLFFVVLCLAAGSWGCSKSSSVPDEHRGSYPVLLLDEEHSQANPSIKDAPSYKIAPADGLVLDATQYDFSKARYYKGRNPDAVQIVVGDQFYKVKCDAREKKYTIDPTTTTCIRGNEPFSKFKPGDNVIVGIGYSGNASNDELFVMWAGVIDVR